MILAEVRGEIQMRQGGGDMNVEVGGVSEVVHLAIDGAIAIKQYCVLRIPYCVLRVSC